MIFLVYSQFHCAIFVLRNMKLIISIFAFSGGSADGPFLRKKNYPTVGICISKTTA